jgi:Domain of unknown function (DUF4412)
MRPTLRTPRSIQLAAALLLVALAPAAPAAAGIHYQATTSVQPAKGEAQTMQVEAWVDGDKAKVEFRDSSNPMTPAGTYMVTQDAGKTLFLVNPEQKTYAEWNLDQMLQTLGGVMHAMGPMLKLEFSDPKVEKLAEEGGPTMLGLPTTHYRYRTTYESSIRIMGMHRSSTVDRLQDLWMTQSLGAPGLGVWLRKGGPATGDPDLDKMISAEMSKMQGFPLKSVEVSTSTDDKKGQQTVTRSQMEVTALDRDVSVPPANFVVPPDYQRVEMMPAGEQGGSDEKGDEKSRNPLRKLFGGGGG